MPIEPQNKRVCAFFDGQNLFHSAKKAFGYQYPNYDPLLLAEAVVARQPGWVLAEVHFYTGVPSSLVSPHWNHFWIKKLQAMGSRGVKTFTRPLRYRNTTVALPGGATTAVQVGQEKGIDVRIAIDIVRFAIGDKYDVALIFSQDQDLSEVSDEIRKISQLEQRWMKVASAFPVSATTNNSRGVNKTDWLAFDKALYDGCIDPADYRQTVSL